VRSRYKDAAATKSLARTLSPGWTQSHDVPKSLTAPYYGSVPTPQIHHQGGTAYPLAPSATTDNIEDLLPPGQHCGVLQALVSMEAEKGEEKREERRCLGAHMPRWTRIDEADVKRGDD
jgi:hypothetical protein